MDDFSTPGQNSRFGYPPTPSNYIKPKKRPVSSMTPVILTDKNGDAKLITGASGGPKIITAVAQVRSFYVYKYFLKKCGWKKVLCLAEPHKFCFLWN